MIVKKDMKEEIKIRDSGIWAIILVLFLGFLFLTSTLEKIAAAIEHNTAVAEKMIVSKSTENGSFILREGTYSGWEMGCNYDKGSNADSQKYLTCANGLGYKQ